MAVVVDDTTRQIRDIRDARSTNLVALLAEVIEMGVVLVRRTGDQPTIYNDNGDEGEEAVEPLPRVTHHPAAFSPVQRLGEDGRIDDEQRPFRAVYFLVANHRERRNILLILTAWSGCGKKESRR